MVLSQTPEQAASDSRTSLPATNPSALTSSQLSALETLLAQETQTYGLVVDTLTKKRDILAQGDYQQLVPLDQHLVGLGQKTIQLELQRLSMMEQMGYANRTLAQLIQSLQPEQRPALDEARTRMLHVVQQIHDLNQTNKRLIHGSLKWVEKTMEAVNTAIAPQGASYSAQGDRPQHKPHASNPIQSTFIHDA